MTEPDRLPDDLRIAEGKEHQKLSILLRQQRTVLHLPPKQFPLNAGDFMSRKKLPQGPRNVPFVEHDLSLPADSSPSSIAIETESSASLTGHSQD
jgi:hypothetical protein